jgi:hypothetical protein
MFQLSDEDRLPIKSLKLNTTMVEASCDSFRKATSAKKSPKASLVPTKEPLEGLITTEVEKNSDKTYLSDPDWRDPTKTCVFPEEEEGDVLPREIKLIKELTELSEAEKWGLKIFPNACLNKKLSPDCETPDKSSLLIINNRCELILAETVDTDVPHREALKQLNRTDNLVSQLLGHTELRGLTRHKLVFVPYYPSRKPQWISKASPTDQNINFWFLGQNSDSAELKEKLFGSSQSAGKSDQLELPVAILTKTYCSESLKKRKETGENILELLHKGDNYISKVNI